MEASLKKFILAGSAAAALAFAGTAVAGVNVPNTAGAEGCAQPGAGSCTYSPTSAGGAATHGSYDIQITQQTANGPVTTDLGGNVPQACSVWSPPGGGSAVYSNVISVTLTVNDNQSGGAIGDPFPTALQSAASGGTAC